MSQRNANRFWSTLAYLVILGVVVFSVGPILWTIITSLKPEQDIVTSELQYLPRNITLDNYVAIWNRSGYPRLIGNSTIVTVITLVICMLVGTLAAYGFSRYQFRGRTQLLLVYLVIRMFPVVLMIVPLWIMMRGFGLLNTHFGLALAYTTFLLPICIWMMKGFFDAIPPELEDAARIDGCTRLSALFRVVMPLARGGLVATAVFIGIAAWNEYLFALMFTNSQNSQTWPVGLALMVGEFQLPWGALSAGGVISVIPVIILFGIVQQSLVRGLTAGAVKG
ncbi:MAG: carbohydrate ABC transporter permease [Anaerolineae bacterium]|nr:carbohydrate ABC transporter permease [Anaerolineae bacterium]